MCLFLQPFLVEAVCPNVWWPKDCKTAKRMKFGKRHRLPKNGCWAESKCRRHPAAKQQWRHNSSTKQQLCNRTRRHGTDKQQKCSIVAAKVHQVCSIHASEMQQKGSRSAAEVQPKCNRSASGMQQQCSINAAERQQHVAEAQQPCSRSASEMRQMCSSSAAEM